jgi:hypothetical protein
MQTKPNIVGKITEVHCATTTSYQNKALTLRKMRSLRFSGVSASRLTVEGGIQRRFVERERDSSLQHTMYM